MSSKGAGRQAGFGLWDRREERNVRSVVLCFIPGVWLSLVSITSELGRIDYNTAGGVDGCDYIRAVINISDSGTLESLATAGR